MKATRSATKLTLSAGAVEQLTAILANILTAEKTIGFTATVEIPKADLAFLRAIHDTLIHAQ